MGGKTQHSIFTKLLLINSVTHFLLWLLFTISSFFHFSFCLSHTPTLCLPPSFIFLYLSEPCVLFPSTLKLMPTGVFVEYKPIVTSCKSTHTCLIADLIRKILNDLYQQLMYSINLVLHKTT